MSHLAPVAPLRQSTIPTPLEQPYLPSSVHFPADIQPPDLLDLHRHPTENPLLESKAHPTPTSPTALSAPIFNTSSSSSSFAFLSPTDSEKHFEAVVAAENKRLDTTTPLFGNAPKKELQVTDIATTRLSPREIDQASVEGPTTTNQSDPNTIEPTSFEHRYSSADRQEEHSSNIRVQQEKQLPTTRGPPRPPLRDMGWVPPTFNPFTYLRRGRKSVEDKNVKKLPIAHDTKSQLPANTRNGVVTLDSHQNDGQGVEKTLQDRHPESFRSIVPAAECEEKQVASSLSAQKQDSVEGKQLPLSESESSTNNDKEYPKPNILQEERKTNNAGRGQYIPGQSENLRTDALQHPKPLQLHKVVEEKAVKREATSRKVRRRSRRKSSGSGSTGNGRISVKRAQRDKLQEKWKEPSKSEESVAWKKFMQDLDDEALDFGPSFATKKVEVVDRNGNVSHRVVESDKEASKYAIGVDREKLAVSSSVQAALGKEHPGQNGIIGPVGVSENKPSRSSKGGSAKRKPLIQNTLETLDVSRAKRKSTNKRSSTSSSFSQRRSLPFWEMNAHESPHSFSRQEEFDESRLRRTVSDESEYRSTDGKSTYRFQQLLPVKGILRSSSTLESESTSMAKTSRSTGSRVRFAELDSVFEFWKDEEEASWELEDDDVLGLPDRMHMVIKLAGKSLRKQKSFWRAGKNLVKFLQDVDCTGANVYKGEALRIAVFRYERIWLPIYCAYLMESHKLKGELNGKMERRMTRLVRAVKKVARLKDNEPLFGNVVPVPPIDVAWVWFLHRCSPKMYKADCERVFGVTLHTQRKNAFKYEASGSPARNVASRKRWKEFVHAFSINRSTYFEHILRNKYFPRHLWSYKTYDGDSDRTPDATLVPESWEPRSSYNLILAARRQRDLLSICTGDDLEELTCSLEPLTLYRYMTYLHLAGTKKKFLPMPDIEPILYAHMAASKTFHDDCTKIAGRLVEPDAVNMRKVLETDQGAELVELSDLVWRGFIEDDDLDYCLSDVYQSFRSPSRTRSGFLDMCIADGRSRVHSRRTRKSSSMRHA